MAMLQLLALVVMVAGTECIIQRSIVDILSGMTEKPVEYKPSGIIRKNQPSRLGCGWRNPYGIADRITRNMRSNFGEFPWTLAVFKVINNEDVYECSASLIHPRVGLSVAHYFADGGQQWRVRAGEWNLLQSNVVLRHQTSEVASVLMHELYDKVTYAYNVALLFLGTSISTEYPTWKHVGFACLAPAALTPPTSLCVVNGWGKSQYHDINMQPIMKMVEVPMVNFTHCESVLQSLLGVGFSLHQSMVCAGGMEGRDACTGDGGAPLSCAYEETSDRYYQVGIVSWGIDCGLKGIPGVYTSVTAVRDWIDRNVIAHGYNTNTYTP